MQRLQSTWQTLAKWCFKVLPWEVCLVSLLERDKEAQSTSPTRLLGVLQRWRLHGPFWALWMQCPACPSAHHRATSTFPTDSHRSRACRRSRQAQANFYLPVCTERTVGDPILQWGTQHAACRLQGPSRSGALDKIGGLSWQNPHPADLVRFGTWKSAPWQLPAIHVCCCCL